MGKKVSFAAVFKVIIRRKAIPDEAYIYIAELIVNKTALKKRDKENNLILNQLHDIQTNSKIGIKRN